MIKARTTGLLIATLLMGSVLGVVSGLIWAFVLSVRLLNGAKVGLIVGLIIGVLFFLFQRVGTASGNLQDKEMTFTAGSMMTLIFVFSTVGAIATGIVRWLFF